MAYQIITDKHGYTIQNENVSIPLIADNVGYQLMLDDIIEQGASCFEGDIPAEIQAEADQKLFDRQLRDYKVARDRLAKYALVDGKPEETITFVSGVEIDEVTKEETEVTETVVTEQAIDPLPATVTRVIDDGEGNETTEEIENPEVAQDNRERAAAQAVVDATPQAVKDAAD